MKKLFQISKSILSNNKGFWPALLAGALIGLVSGAYQAHQQRKMAEEQNKLQAQASAESLRIEAGKAQGETKQNTIKTDDEAAKKSAWQGMIASRASEKGNSKFGAA